MKKITLIVAMLLVVTSGKAQQLYLETGKTISLFDYNNSQGNSLENLQSSSHSFMAIGYKNQIFTKNVNWSLGVIYAGYGAIGSEDSIDNFMEWDLNYVALNTGLDYALFNVEKLTLYVKGTVSVGFLVQGTQTLNNMVFNLKDNNDFDNTLIDFRGGAGFLHPISENLSFYVQYMYGKSLDLAESKEKLRIVSNNLSFGLLINLPKVEKSKKKLMNQTSNPK